MEPEWDKWVDNETKTMEKMAIKAYMKPEMRSVWELHPITQEEMIAKIRKSIRTQLVAKAQELKNEYTEPQKNMDFTINFDFDLPRIPPYVYDGPQNVEALM